MAIARAYPVCDFGSCQGDSWRHLVRLRRSSWRNENDWHRCNAAAYTRSRAEAVNACWTLVQYRPIQWPASFNPIASLRRLFSLLGCFKAQNLPRDDDDFFTSPGVAPAPRILLTDGKNAKVFYFYIFASFQGGFDNLKCGLHGIDAVATWGLVLIAYSINDLSFGHSHFSTAMPLLKRRPEH